MSDEFERSGILAKLAEAVAGGDENGAVELTRHEIAVATSPRRILDAMIAGMADVGERFKRDEAFVPEMMIAARAMKAATVLVEPLLVKAGIRPEHTVVIGTVAGDMHDVGKNLVAMMWRGSNFEVVDLGVDVAPERFVEAACECGARVVGLSTLLTTTMPGMASTVEALRAANGAELKIVIGGAAVTSGFADSIGADAYAANAATAVDVARELLAR